MADQTERMNLAAIKRVDPYAKSIVDSSAHVAFYTFNSSETEWEKTDVEGAFFIYSRNAEPFFSIFINNRLNTNSLVEPISGQLELQVSPILALISCLTYLFLNIYFAESATVSAVPKRAKPHPWLLVLQQNRVRPHW